MQKSRERINEAAGAARKGLPSRRIASDYNKEYVLKLENENEPTVKTESGNLSQRPSGGSDGGLELSIEVPEGQLTSPLTRELCILGCELDWATCIGCCWQSVRAGGGCWQRQT